MAVRRQRATTSQEIMEKDIDLAIKKSKVRFRFVKVFYILKYTDTYFASGYPDKDKITMNDIYFQKWIFEENKNRWELVL